MSKAYNNPALSLEAGCSALAWSTEDGTHLWGRNYDFDRLAEGSGMTFLPRGTSYFGVNGPDGTAFPCTSRYACAGMGLLLEPSPVLYEGINEKGLMGGQLYYRGFAEYAKDCRAGTQPLQPPFLVFHMLAQCASVEEVVRCLQDEITLADIPMMGTVAPLHWSFHDRTGETIVIEPEESGLRIYRNTLGVMTNSPGYSWHRLNLLNYAGIRDLDYAGVELQGGNSRAVLFGKRSPGSARRLEFAVPFCPSGLFEKVRLAGEGRGGRRQPDVSSFSERGVPSGNGQGKP